MRTKTVPRHRILQKIKIISATKISSDDENVQDIENPNATVSQNRQNAYQAYASSSTIFFPIITSTASSNGLTSFSSTTSTSSLLTNDDNNNVEVINLSTKDATNHLEEIATGISAEPEDKLKDSFLYKIMTDPNFLENIQRNKQPKKFVCLFCKEEFATCDELTSHMDAKKDNSNQIPCCACKKTFAEKRYLKYHQRCHSERTKFTCDICTRKYTRLDNLTRHNVLHVNPDKFACTICSRTFTRKDLLNKHRKSHEKCNLYCKKCGKYFRSVITLGNHQKTHREVSNATMSVIVCDNENSLSGDSNACETQDLTLDKSVVCKTDGKARKTQNSPSDIR
ncbi:hypothetical protein DMN91_009029 [Ooceraea biroi]|uniref:C2H2-type domain-containing protein n=1 Tax=Ooceraea biroi TaxID=2015173 RepID=A0A026WSA4_OOCBI|nr:zinc finger protein 573 [Ooceraea biroi]EZA58848.1 hypothetical protein X777_15017 [Ooceraea biroi]RLU18672.1 hypothetical protein DMN91_009029 [Ooceraea biroi]